jgi:hypothetical protein
MTRINKNNFRKGFAISYDKEIMFKGTQLVTAKITAIFSKFILLENGDEFNYINSGNCVYLSI